MARRMTEDTSPRRVRRLSVRVSEEERGELCLRAMKVFGDDPNVAEFARLLTIDDIINPIKQKQPDKP
jgi:hypothetical protein